MIELRISWKALLFAALFYWLSKDSEALEAVKKNTAPMSDGMDSRQDFIDRNVQNDLVDLCETIYSPNNRRQVIYERPTLKSRFSS